MKTVKKSDVEALARITRKYAKTGDTDILDIRHNIARKMSICSFGNDSKWLAFCDLFGALCGVAPLKNCTNDEIIAALNLIGFEVV